MELKQTATEVSPLMVLSCLKMLPSFLTCERIISRVCRFNNKAFGNGYMALHTDSAYAPTQPEYLALLCIESAVEGGTSLLMSAERLISLVFDDKSPEAFMENNSVTYVSLSNGRYKSAKSNIFYMKENKPCCKFTTLSTAIIPSSKSSGQKFLKTISMISDPKNIKHVKLSPWDLLFIDNSRWLHGRTPFQGNRKIIRYCFIKD